MVSDFVLSLHTSPRLLEQCKVAGERNRSTSFVFYTFRSVQDRTVLQVQVRRVGNRGWLHCAEFARQYNGDLAGCLSTSQAQLTSIPARHPSFCCAFQVGMGSHSQAEGVAQLLAPLQMNPVLKFAQDVFAGTCGTLSVVNRALEISITLARPRSVLSPSGSCFL